jgi:mono/diheme cytochrome c family protein
MGIPIRLASLCVPVALWLCATPALAADGAALYKAKCSGCHGLDGKADTPAAKAMKVPPLAGKALAPDDVVQKLRASERHESVTSRLSDEELVAIATAIPK